MGFWFCIINVNVVISKMTKEERSEKEGGVKAMSVSSEQNKGRRRRNFLRNYELYLFLLPAIIWYLIFCYAPMYGIRIAFTDYKTGMKIAEAPWVGFEKFTTFFASKMFLTSVTNTVLLSVYQLLAGFLPPIIFALMLNQIRNGPFKKLVQNVSYMPNFISTVVLVGMLNAFLSTQSGIINQLIERLGGRSQAFLTKAKFFRGVYVISGVWQGTGWGAIVYLAALSGVNPEYYEAATLDGASRLQKIWDVDIPCILPTIIILLILNVGNILSVGFEKALLMQQGSNLKTSEIISTYVYKVGLVNADYASSTAIGLMNSVVNFFMLIVTNFIAKRVSGTGLW